METLETALDENGNQVVILPDIIFSGKQNIDWNEVEKYLERFVGKLVEIAKTGDIIYCLYNGVKTLALRRNL